MAFAHPYKQPTVNEILYVWLPQWKEMTVHTCIVALVLLTSENDDGFASKHLNELAKESRTNPKTLDKSLKVLMKRGVLEVIPGATQKQFSAYRLHHWHKAS